MRPARWYSASGCGARRCLRSSLVGSVRGGDGSLQQCALLGACDRRTWHTVRLISPVYVKPFVKRQKHDTTDAEAICEAAQRPTMRFVSVKSEAAQANAVVFRARDLLVQRTQTINALRGHLGEYGIVVAKGPCHVVQLIAHITDPTADLPEAARTVLRMLTASLQFLAERISLLDREIARRPRADKEVRRLTTIPGVGPVIATAVAALAPPAGASGSASTSPPGSGSRRCSAPAELNKSLVRSRKWASERCDVDRGASAARLSPAHGRLPPSHRPRSIIGWPAGSASIQKTAVPTIAYR
jgi:transposase